MGKMIALYVKKSTTFTTNTKIESITGPSVAAGEVTLVPGFYRYPAGARVDPKLAVREMGGEDYLTYEVDPLKGGGLPDPPLQAAQQYGKDQIQSFLGGASAPPSVFQ